MSETPNRSQNSGADSVPATNDPEDDKNAGRRAQEWGERIETGKSIAEGGEPPPESISELEDMEDTTEEDSAG